MRVLIAFDKFKDALTAPAACEIAREVLATERPDWTVELCPLADGGDGFATILTTAAGGNWQSVEVTGPRGSRETSGFGLIEQNTLPIAALELLELPGITRLGIIEMATASGLQSLAENERDPWHCDSRGTGEAIAAALAAGAEAIVLGVGGSATNDLGVGALAALGWQPVDAKGQPLQTLAPSGWEQLAGFRKPDTPMVPVRIACDVANPLLGPRGATTVFGPQKGLRSEDCDRLENEVARVANLLGEAAGHPGLEATPGAGAAGGIAFGFLTAADARLVPGFDLVEAWLGIAPKLAEAELVITGEGCFDASSLEGKGPGSLFHRAQAQGISVWVLAGAVDLPSGSPNGARVAAITPPDTSLPEALRTTPENLATTLREFLANTQ